MKTFGEYVTREPQRRARAAADSSSNGMSTKSSVSVLDADVVQELGPEHGRNLPRRANLTGERRCRPGRGLAESVTAVRSRSQGYTLGPGRKTQAESVTADRSRSQG